MNSRFKIDRKFWPLLVTITLFLGLYLWGVFQYRGFSSPQVFYNLFIDNAFLLITAIGMTLVILTNGIDLSVGAVIALTTVVSAWMLEELHLGPAITIAAVLLGGIAFGAVMGSIIHFFKVQPFIVTLAGMFFARGMCFVISTDAITITDPFYRAVGLARVPMPGGFISVNVVIALVVLAAAFYLTQFTQFGRTIHAIGGSEQSALLMGLPVRRTKILTYSLNGFCSALAGVVFSIYMLSGYGLYTSDLELDAIAAVVIGGTQLTGGIGYVVGTVLGVLIEGLIQVIIMFQGNVNSWWTRIIIGLLTLLFIGMQSLFFSNSSAARKMRARNPARPAAPPAPEPTLVAAGKE